MSGFIIMLVYVVIVCALLGLLWWALESTSLPQPIKVTILIVLVCVGVLYFVQGGYLESLPRR